MVFKLNNLGSFNYNNPFNIIMENNYTKYVNSSRQKRVLKLDKIITEKNGVWLNKHDYDGSCFFCEIKCKNNHIFKIINRRVDKGTWCPKCLSKINIGEELCRAFLVNLLGCSFDKTRRLPGLVSPISNYPLEIDGFSKIKKIGFEYQGRQHFQYCKYIQKKEENFQRLQICDNVKRQYFKDNNFILIEIMEFSNFSLQVIYNQITNVLDKLQIKYKKMTVDEIKNNVKDFFNEKKQLKIKKKEPRWTEEKAMTIIKNCSNINEIRKNYYALYQWMVYKKNLKKLTKNLKRRNNKQTFDINELKEIAKKYQTRTDFKKYDWTAYKFALKIKQLDLICSHMKYSGEGTKFKKKIT